MSKKTLYLVRHGNTFEAHETPRQVGLKTDMSLTAKGKEQAVSVATYLKDKKISQNVYRGPLKRHEQSLNLIQNELKQDFTINVIDAFTEIDYGLWENKTQAEIKAEWPTEYEKWASKGLWPEHIFEGSLKNHIADLQKWLLHISQTDDDNILVVTSQGIIRFFLSFIYDNKSRHDINLNYNEHKVAPGNVCEVQVTFLKDGALPTFETMSWNLSPKAYITAPV